MLFLFFSFLKTVALTVEKIKNKCSSIYNNKNSIKGNVGPVREKNLKGLSLCKFTKSINHKIMVDIKYRYCYLSFHAWVQAYTKYYYCRICSSWEMNLNIGVKARDDANIQSQWTMKCRSRSNMDTVVWGVIPKCKHIPSIINVAFIVLGK